VTEPEKHDDNPCSSNTINNSKIDSNTDLPELNEILGIGLYINTKIFDNKFKYDLLKKPWQHPTYYNFPVISKRKFKFKLSWIARFSWLVYSKKLEGTLKCINK